MQPLTSTYVFALCNAGSEKALKDEVAATRPGWRPSYQQRGFVTFKAPSEAGPFSVGTIKEPPAFARRLCLSRGKVNTREDALRLLGEAALVHQLRLTRGRVERTAEPDTGPVLGQTTGTIVELAPEEFWAGLHVHAPLLSPDPGGCSSITLPEGVPSRAWLKLEEAARFFGLTFSPRDIVVELGCAPGGVILALLQRGVSVIGVDPAKLAPVVMASAVPELPLVPRPAPWVFHCRKPAALVSKRDLGTRTTWFMSDMNQSPAVAIKECARFIRMCPAIRSALITLKLTDLAEASDMPVWLQSLRDMGFKTVRVTAIVGGKA